MLRMLITFFLVSLSSSEAAIKILALGDSLTEGLGVQREQAYPYLLEKSLKAQGFEVLVINAGVSGSTSATAYGRLKAYLNQEIDIMILALGANDGLRGLSLKHLESNLSKTIRLAKSEGIKVILAGMKIPTNLGPDYTESFAAVYDHLEKEHAVVRVPFLLEGVAGNKDLNIADGIHPNTRGHELIADNLLPIFMEVFQKDQIPRLVNEENPEN